MPNQRTPGSRGGSLDMRGDIRSRERLMAVLRDEREFINSSQGRYNEANLDADPYSSIPQNRVESPIEIKYHDE